MAAGVMLSGQANAFTTTGTLLSFDAGVYRTEPKVGTNTKNNTDAADGKKVRNEGFVVDTAVHKEKTSKHGDESPISPLVRIHIITTFSITGMSRGGLA